MQGTQSPFSGVTRYSSAGGSIAKNVEVGPPQMIHKNSIKLDSINTFMPLLETDFAKLT